MAQEDIQSVIDDMKEDPQLIGDEPRGEMKDFSDEVTGDSSSDNFKISNLKASRSELEIKKNLREIKEQCGELEDQDQAVACFSAAQKADTEITRAIQGEK